MITKLQFGVKTSSFVFGHSYHSHKPQKSGRTTEKIDKNIGFYDEHTLKIKPQNHQEFFGEGTGFGTTLLSLFATQNELFQKFEKRE